MISGNSFGTLIWWAAYKGSCMSARVRILSVTQKLRQHNMINEAWYYLRNGMDDSTIKRPGSFCVNAPNSRTFSSWISNAQLEPQNRVPIE